MRSGFAFDVARCAGLRVAGVGAAAAQPEFVTGVTDAIHQRPVEHLPQPPERRVLPGANIGLEPGNPFPVRRFQVQAGQEIGLVDVGFASFGTLER